MGDRHGHRCDGFVLVVAYLLFPTHQFGELTGEGWRRPYEEARLQRLEEALALPPIERPSMWYFWGADEEWREAHKQWLRPVEERQLAQPVQITKEDE